MYLNDVFSVPASALRACPRCRCRQASTVTGLPLGLQIIGKPFDEQGVLNAGLAIEQRAGSLRPSRKVVVR
jgi:aspartyl-tRNA(Asn)/glutamyl-tRNA(Gln) amidotransferase subunit A